MSANADSDPAVDTDADADIGTADTMRERGGGSKLAIWLLMSMNRFVIAGGLALLVFAGFVAISLVEPSGIATSSSIQYLFSSMIGAIVTGTTLVLTIGQLVISEENGPLGDQHQRMSNTMNVRTYVSELIGTTSPADPSTFLQALIDTVNKRAESLGRTVHKSDNDDLRTQVDELVDSVRSNAQRATDELEGKEFGTFDVIRAALNFNYTWDIFQVERMLDEFEDDLTETQIEAFKDLKTALTLFGPAREHVKTLYFRWELINLSRYILYVAIPALIVAGAILMFVSPETFSGRTFAVPNATWVLGAAFSFTSLPFLVFTAYIFRIVTIAKQTLAIGPFVLRSSQR